MMPKSIALVVFLSVVSAAHGQQQEQVRKLNPQGLPPFGQWGQPTLGVGSGPKDATGQFVVGSAGGGGSKKKSDDDGGSKKKKEDSSDVLPGATSGGGDSSSDDSSSMVGLGATGVPGVAAAGGGSSGKGMGMMRRRLQNQHSK